MRQDFKQVSQQEGTALPSYVHALPAFHLTVIMKIKSFEETYYENIHFDFHFVFSWRVN